MHDIFIIFNLKLIKNNRNTNHNKFFLNCQKSTQYIFHAIYPYMFFLVNYETISVKLISPYRYNLILVDI